MYEVKLKNRRKKSLNGIYQIIAQKTINQSYFF